MYQSKTLITKHLVVKDSRRVTLGPYRPFSRPVPQNGFSLLSPFFFFFLLVEMSAISSFWADAELDTLGLELVAPVFSNWLLCCSGGSAFTSGSMLGFSSLASVTLAFNSAPALAGADSAVAGCVDVSPAAGEAVSDRGAS